jgi:branched-subunit amino acid aminotransferase/4-amino-4-deoxychorismate lyase
MGHFIFNGRFYKDGEAVVGPGNRGLRYGDGVFETMKMIDGEIVLADAHFARMWKGMQVLGFDIPKLMAPENFTREVTALTKKNGHEKKARIRLQVFRGDGGLYDAVNNTPNYIIESWALTDVHDTLNSNGLEVGIYTGAKKACDITSNLKHCNFLPYALAALHAKKEKWNDALLLNQYERVCDSTIANIFIIKQGIIFTPALSEGCVAGVMREQVIASLKATDWQVNETALHVNDILDADEVFLTNSV